MQQGETKTCCIVAPLWIHLVALVKWLNGYTRGQNANTWPKEHVQYPIGCVQSCPLSYTSLFGHTRASCSSGKMFMHIDSLNMMICMYKSTFEFTAAIVKNAGMWYVKMG